VLVQHTHQPLEHLATSARDLAQRDLGGQLSPEVALLVDDRNRGNNAMSETGIQF